MIRYIFSLTSVLLVTLPCFSQEQEYQFLSQEEVDRQFHVLNALEDFPTEALYPGATEVLVSKVLNEFALGLLFKLSDSTYVCTSIADAENAHFVCRSPWVSYNEGAVFTECRWMKGIMMEQYWRISGYTITFEGDTMYDLNAEVYAQAEQAIKENNPLKYCEAYSGAQYYSDHQYRAQDVLIWVDTLALQYYQNQDYSKAAQLFHSIQIGCDCTDERTAALFPEQFPQIWSNASLYYLKAELYQECIDLCSWLLNQYPTLTSAYLQYADALYALDKMEASKVQYQQYYDQMVEAGKKDQIPSRVKRRK